MPRRRRFVPLWLCLIACPALWSAPARAGASLDPAACPAAAAPRIAISAPFPPVRYDATRTTGELANDLSGGTGAFHVTVLGLTTVQAVHKLSWDVAWAELRDGTWCAGLTRVGFLMGFDLVLVHTARELENEPCLKNEVMAHEEHHVALHRESLNEFIQQLPGVAGQVGMVRAGTLQDAEQAVTDRLETGFRDLAQSWAAADEARQRDFDSPQEYARLGRVCGGRAQKLFHGQGRGPAA